MKLYSNIADTSTLQNGNIIVAILGETKNGELSSVEAIKELTIAQLNEYQDGFCIGLDTENSNKKARLEKAELKSLPSCPILFWSFDARQKTTLDNLVKALNKQYLRPRFSCGVGNSDALLINVLNLSFNDARVYAKRSSDLNKALSQLRQEHEQTRKVLQNMQDILWNIRGNPPRMTSVTKLGRGRINLNKLKKYNTNSISQKLLVPTKGLAGLDIYVAETCDAPGILRCELLITATQERVALWQMQYNDMQTGWIHFPLSTIFSQSHSSAELKITFTSPYDESPTIGLTDEIIITSAYMKINNEPQTGKILAMRTWGGFPGIKNESVSSNLPSNEDKAFFEYKLPYSILSNADVCIKYETDFSYLIAHPTGEILLHPLFDKEVSAYVEKALPRGFKEIEAEVIVKGECASKTEFAVAAVPQGTDPTKITPNSKECIGSSGWSPISQNFTPELIGFTLKEPYNKGELDLYIFTRVPKGQSVDYCQATFNSIKITLDMPKAKTIEESPSVLSFDASISDDVIDEKYVLKTVKEIEDSILKTAYPLYQFNLNFVQFEVCPDKKIMLHPIENRINVALIPKAVPAGTKHIIADIQVGKKCISNVQFGIAVPVGTYNPDLIGAFDPTSKSLSSSNWKIIGVGTTQGTIKFTLPDVLAKNTDLYIFTKLVDGESMDYADSYFQNIRFGKDVSNLSETAKVANVVIK